MWGAILFIDILPEWIEALRILVYILNTETLILSAMGLDLVHWNLDNVVMTMFLSSFFLSSVVAL